MREEYSFHIPLTALPFMRRDKNFSQLKSEQGLYLQEVTESAAVSYNIATSKNPYIDGVSVNNRTANPREITITFGYDGTKSPEIADNELFEFLAPALASGKIELHKTQTRYPTEQGSIPVLVYIAIEATIEKIEHLVYTDEPTLQIVLLTESYWHTVRERSYDLKANTSAGTGTLVPYTYNSNTMFEGDVSADARYVIYISSQANAITVDCEFLNHNGTSTPSLIGIRNLVISAGTSATIEIYAGNDGIRATLQTGATETSILQYLKTENLPNGVTPQIQLNGKVAFRLSQDLASVMAQSSSSSVDLFYHPRYIR